MRTKTLALSAVLGMIGTASVVAQTNVYSLNAVGYINVTIPPGFSILTCPLICSPDNTLNTILPNNAVNNGNSPSTLGGLAVFQFNGTGYNQDNANSYSAGWANGGTITVNPGTAIFVQNTFQALGSGLNYNATFVGTVPQGTLTNTLVPGFNLVGSIVPVSGDLATNSILNMGIGGPSSSPNSPAQGGDIIYFFTPGTNGSGGQIGYAGVGDEAAASYSGGWASGAGANGDPVLPSVSQGFYYYNNSINNTPRNEYWVENFSINP